MNKHTILFVATMLFSFGAAQAQPTFTEWGPSDPSPELNCGEYQWPEVWAPCPEVQVKQKHDHTPLERYRREGFDTVVTNCTTEVVLTCTPYIPVQFFNGQYTVDQIPWSPADPTFWINGQGTQLAISNDDNFTTTPTYLDFPFFFFGSKKTQFRVGDNGIVTFCTEAMANDHYGAPSCGYNISQPLPWPTYYPTYPTGNTFGRSHDAIYGVYEDTYTGSNGAYMTGQYATQHPHCGIYYGVIDEYPCRKIIASWNSIPIFSNADVRQTYQMVCYEGSNIIEVHIKDYSGQATTCNGAIVGIQNATGQPQTAVIPGPLFNIHNGAHAAYFPANRNFFQFSGTGGTGVFHNESWRFTPQGDVLKDYGWYIIRPDGSNDTLSTVDNGISCYYDLMQGDDQTLYQSWNDAPCPSLTKCYVRNLTEPTRIVFYLKFHNALDSVYNLQDTVYVGTDISHDINLHAQGKPSTERSMNICAGQTANLVTEWPRVQDTARTTWRIYRMLNGEEVNLSNNLIGITRGSVGDSLVSFPVTLNSAALPPTGMTNKIDSVYLQVSADFSNCSDSHSVFLVKVYPNFDTTVVRGICEGQRYYWTADSAYHAENTDPAVDTVLLKSLPGCDSIVRLDLTVYGRTHSIDTVYACEPYTWVNGQTYYEDNTATALADTILLQNQWGCDSIVHLELHMMPLTALIRTNVDHFTLSQLDVTLNDVSVNGGSRLWLFPDGGTQTAATAYYTLPAELDSALIKMVAYSAYGDCDDTTQVVIPLQRENIWLPNAFIPENNAGNNLFGSISKNTLSEEMYIYNRHGELVYKCEQIDCTWDGKDLNGNACPQGTYVYIIRFRTTFEPDREQLIRGSVTLIR